jgi:hypothetical protein
MIAQAVEVKPKRPRNWPYRIAAIMCFLILATLLPRCYWPSDEVAFRLAMNHMDLNHPGLGQFREVKKSWAWDGSWTFEFDSTPTIRVMVDRHGLCLELPERGRSEYMPEQWPIRR